MGRRPGGTTVDTKEQLLAAAARVIAARGYEGARVSEIAAEAGLSTGAIYAHYDGKADLLCAAINSRGPDAVAGLLDAGIASSVAATLKFLGARLVSGARTGRARIRGDVLIESLAASRREPQVAEVLRESIGTREARLAELIRHGQESGEISAAVSPEAVSRLCMLLALGSVVTRAIDLPAPPIDDWEAVIGSLVNQMQTVEAS
ncbi:MAG: TetR/AcrR family transcriptional regulator [Acidimicrobiia bacterium]